MIITCPDPHPGRCLNLRRNPNDPYGGMTRCVLVEGHNNACRFMHAPVYLPGATSYISNQPQASIEAVES